MNTNEEVTAFYRARLEEINRKAMQWRHLAVAAALVGVGVLASFASVWFLLPAGAALIYLLREWAQFKRLSLELARRRAFVAEGIQRVAGEWFSTHTGWQYTPENHPFATDLNITGDNSLFSILCTARTELGRRRLAEILIDTPSYTDALARQQRVRELMPDAALREEVAILGDYESQESRWTVFEAWLDTPVPPIPPALLWLARASTLVTGVLMGIVVFQVMPWNPLLVEWPRVLVPITGAVAIQMLLRFALRRHVVPIIESSRAIAPDLRICHKGLQLLKTSTDLRAIGSLNKLAGSLTASTQGLLDWPAWLLLADVHVAVAIARWRVKHGAMLRRALDEWAEFEALRAIAGYAFEHPEDAVPELCATPGVFRAVGLGHPLIPSSMAVPNDITLDSATRFLIISGSNMSGKSTLMRTIGMNLVLAGIGAPVRAKAATVSLSNLHAAIQASDSLAEGRSRFLAETERIRDALKEARTGIGVMFLIDELLGGTNSRDRRIAAEHIARAFMAAGAIGAISTHDLALTEIAEDLTLQGANVHMSSVDEDHPFDFDYQLKPGVYRGSNALAIVRLAIG